MIMLPNCQKTYIAQKKNRTVTGAVFFVFVIDA